jgi:hypothetical protein
MTRLDPMALAVLLLVSAGATELRAEGTAKPEAPIIQVLGVRGGLSELTTYRPVGEKFEREGTVRAEPLLKAGIDILEEEKNGVLKARSAGTIYWLDRRELVTTRRHANPDVLCDPVVSAAPGSVDLRSQGLGNSGCRK